jgi:hypothetical protein
MPLIVPRYRPIAGQPNHNTARLERIFTKLTPIRRCARRILNPKEGGGRDVEQQSIPRRTGIGRLGDHGSGGHRVLGGADRRDARTISRLASQPSPTQVEP